MYRAGDWVIPLVGQHKGEEMSISSVRMFATDSGYYLKGDREGGLYEPRQVKFSRERENGNPCGRPCVPRLHEILGTCDCCRGKCFCVLQDAVARASVREALEEKRRSADNIVEFPGHGKRKKEGESDGET
jgi:hypothetical protein